LSVEHETFSLRGEDHLKAIFAKTAARSRRTLLARALGS
jgi:hypothetical protein